MCAYFGGSHLGRNWEYVAFSAEAWGGRVQPLDLGEGNSGYQVIKPYSKERATYSFKDPIFILLFPLKSSDPLTKSQAALQGFCF
jgi:hypothetical protein